MITEIAVLFGIQHFQKRRSGVSFIVARNLIHLIQQHQRVFHACLSQTIDNPSGH